MSADLIFTVAGEAIWVGETKVLEETETVGETKDSLGIVGDSSIAGGGGGRSSS